MRHFGDHSHVVGDQDDRQAALLLQVAQQVQDLRLGGDIERRGGFVGDQHPRVAGQGHGDHHPLAQAAGELERVFVDAAVGLRHTDHVEQFDRAGAGGALAQAHVQQDRLGDLVADGVMLAEAGHRLLEDQCDLRPADAAHRRLRQGREVDRRAAALRAQQDLPAHHPAGAVDDAQDGAGGDALAAAALANHAEGAALEHVEIDAIHGAHDALAAMELGMQVADGQDRVSHKGPPRRAGRHPGS